MFQTLLHWIKLKFSRHELWAINFGLGLPFLSLFGVVSLWVWLFIPMIPIGVFLALLMKNFPLVGSLLNLLIAVPVMLVFAYWFFRWYFICLTLMFGRRKMAEKKKEEVVARIEKLLSTQR
ncbi:hypothetical protein [Pseudovibrio sp. Ad26]|uniref:hypothetical protein n=1 Tax=Pseudovibrio sp. Ad26 TaxID=989410 RepID=UPI0007AE9129|nr:hypothetical protein [Pseudovibrio sp. Ad26]KZK97167.1 hypothetical protein PsAD26_05572 [Pseudovibrio sp. Ad26]